MQLMLFSVILFPVDNNTQQRPTPIESIYVLCGTRDIISPAHARQKGLLTNVDIETKLEKLRTVSKHNSQG